MKFIQEHPTESQMVSLFLDMTGGIICDGMGAPAPIIHLPFPGLISDQPWAIMEAVRAVSAQAARIMTEKKQ